MIKKILINYVYKKEKIFSFQLTLIILYTYLIMKINLMLKLN